MNSKLRDLVKRAILGTTRAVGFKQSEETITGDAQRYWSNPDQQAFGAFSHWRGERGLAHDTWDAIGKDHIALFEQLIKLTGLTLPLERLIDWGCGGGANAVHFAPVTGQLIGVDVSQATLDECAKVLREAGHHNFVPVLIDVATPESALARIKEPADFFLCTYVFELIPTPEYGRRLLQLTHRLLRPGGVALIQIKYTTSESRTRPRRWGYRVNVANMTTYGIDEFWELAREIGFVPKAVTLQPKQPLVNDERYAYFLLERPA